MSDQDVLAVYVTASEAQAPALASALVQQRLAACVSVMPGVRSFYQWQGKLQDESEVMLLIKTTRDRFEGLRAAVVELHEYDVPEVIAVPIAAGHAPYLKWVQDSVQEISE